MKRTRKVTGRKLNIEWNIGTRHALYHQDGHWYEVLNDFPGALCDPNGYILFRTEIEFLNCPYLKIGEKVNVSGDITRIPGYVQVM